MCCIAEKSLACVAKIVLVILNICMILIGLLLLIIGCFVKWGYPHLITLAGNHVPTVNQYSSQLGQSISTDQADPFTQYVSTNVAIPLIVLGLFFCALGFIGVCGAGCGYNILLLIYIIVTAAVCLAQIIAIIAIAAAKETVKTKLEEQFVVGTNDYYVDITNTSTLFSSPFSLVANSLMVKGECCGLTTGEVFKNSNTWNKTYQSYTLTYPYACCKLDNINAYPEVEKITAVDISGCVNSPSSTNSNKDKNCWNYVEQLVNADLPWILTIVILTILGQVAMVILSIILFKDQKSAIGPV